jgi:hypothetical protein
MPPFSGDWCLTTEEETWLRATWLRLPSRSSWVEPSTAPPASRRVELGRARTSQRAQPRPAEGAPADTRACPCVGHTRLVVRFDLWKRDRREQPTFRLASRLRRWGLVAGSAFPGSSRDGLASFKGPGGPDPSGPPGEPGKWGHSSPTDQGRVSPSQAQQSIRSPRLRRISGRRRTLCSRATGRRQRDSAANSSRPAPAPGAAPEPAAPRAGTRRLGS